MGGVGGAEEEAEEGEVRAEEEVEEVGVADLVGDGGAGGGVAEEELVKEKLLFEPFAGALGGFRCLNQGDDQGGDVVGTQRTAARLRVRQE